MKFFPSVCADRGPVADTEVGTVGNGRGGTSLFLLRFDPLALGCAFCISPSSSVSLVIGVGIGPAGPSILTRLAGWTSVPS
jgi:hypothetical protein